MSAGQLLHRTASPASVITVEKQMTPAQAELFFELYLEAFGGLHTRAVASQVIDRDQFLDQMTDERVEKFVAWSEDEQPLGLTTLTRHLDTVPWISPQYFLARYPDAAREHRVFYLGFTFTRVGRRQYWVLAAMLTEVIQRLKGVSAICGYDICAFNNDTIRFGDHLELMMKRLADVTVEKIDTQTYYSATFS
ncbi:MAG TPA: hypothetical protein VFP89_08690 [Propionibacteriaceae bacterium]|nr:hypothetical protein [Propionibacteriaceae bacterium]